MKMRYTITSGIAAFGFAFLSQMALADPVAQYSASAVNGQVTTAAQNAIELTRFARGRVAVRRGPGRTVVRGRSVVAGRHVYAGRRVGYWRNGRWIGPAAVGVGVAAGAAAAGGSCYWNCRNSGNGPAYCRANAGNFC